jgi:hypothetical protein
MHSKAHRQFQVVIGKVAPAAVRSDLVTTQFFRKFDRPFLQGPADTQPAIFPANSKSEHLGLMERGSLELNRWKVIIRPYFLNDKPEEPTDFLSLEGYEEMGAAMKTGLEGYPLALAKLIDYP